MAVVPAVLSLSFSTPALSTVNTLLSCSIFSAAPAITSACTTTLTSSRVLFPSSRTNMGMTPDFLHLHTVECTAAESWCRCVWRAVLLGDLPCWVTLTTVSTGPYARCSLLIWWPLKHKPNIIPSQFSSTQHTMSQSQKYTIIMYSMICKFVQV